MRPLGLPLLAPLHHTFLHPNADGCLLVVAVDFYVVRFLRHNPSTSYIVDEEDRNRLLEVFATSIRRCIVMTKEIFRVIIKITKRTILREFEIFIDWWFLLQLFQGLVVLRNILFSLLCDECFQFFGVPQNRHIWRRRRGFIEDDDSLGLPFNQLHDWFHSFQFIALIDVEGTQYAFLQCKSVAIKIHECHFILQLRSICVSSDGFRLFRANS
mmetsp:Transcript_25932/g.43212  ORF Transcript_25932/g.43212 Transcript_25932/m.43212 type:complete len:213 (+) Transcript_25932:1376-2014(+)